MNNKKRASKKHIVYIVSILVFIIIVISMYIFHENFKQCVDEYIFRKAITEQDIISIDLETDKSNQIHIYNKYIAILNNQNLTLYNNFGEKVTSINVKINKAIFDSNNKYLAIAERGEGEVCLILDKTYLWSNRIEGEILQIHVNRNGYLAVITKDSTYKSILTLYNSDGTQLFKNYFAETRIVNVSVSDDNKYLAIGEIDLTGVLIKSNIKVLSIDDVKSGKDDSFIYAYNAENGRLLTNIEYQSKGQLVCMYDDSIHSIKDGECKEIINTKDKQIAFMSANLKSSIVYIEEEKSGVFKTNSHINIMNTQNNHIYTYNLDDVTKELFVNNDIIAVNTGNEVYFLDTKGWLKKKFSTKQEVSDIMLSKDLAGIIYKDKIIIIDL